MRALVYDQNRQAWDNSVGFIKCEVPVPRIDRTKKEDRESVIVKVAYAGVCGTDRGLWYRTNFKDAVLSSLAAEHKSQRVIGHEICGEIVEMGKGVADSYPLILGDFVTAESHLICRTCRQCRRGQTNVCRNEKIIGISHDGGFADYIKLPAHVLWKVDPAIIRPEVACLMEQLGNAVHAADVAEVAGQHIAIFGAGPIGLFLIMIAGARGAASITVSEPKASSRRLARQLGASRVLTPAEMAKEQGADITFDMVGLPEVTNGAIRTVRRGGRVILFGLKAGDLTIPNFEQVIRGGLTLQAVIGRRVWQTWERLEALLQDAALGIQDSLWTYLLKRGCDTILPLTDFTPAEFERRMTVHPKLILKIS